MRGLAFVSSAYQVIARKWRPQTFADVVGQDHVVRTLRNAIDRGRIAHAYLFVGPRGTGKTSTARIFAKALNCTGGPKADFDPEDPVVKSIADGTSMDVIEIDGASNNSVDQIRDLRDDVRYAPAHGKFKIYIIDEVHMLSNQAFNALLKTLEEPPPHVKFIFATTDVQKVLPTILSRCQRFDLKPIPNDLIVARLKKIGADEKVQATDGALASIARMADGGMRDAQSIFDQMISFCGAEISENDVLEVYGLVSAETIAELAGAVAAGNHAKIVEIVDQCDENGRDLVRLLSDLQSLVREALLEAIAKGGKTTALGGVSMTTEQITRLLDGLREGEGSVKLGLAERINFEVTLLKAVEASRARAIDSLIQELCALAEEAPSAADREKKKGLTALDRLAARLPLTPEPTLARPSLPEVARKGTAATNAGPSGGGGGAPPAASQRRADAEVSGLREDTDPSDLEATTPISDDDRPPLETILADEETESFREGESLRPRARTPVEEVDDTQALPALDDLVARIPAPVMDGLEELFRARFVKVTRVPSSALNSGAVPEGGK